MEKRVKRTRTLNGLLFGYLVRTILACAAVAILWFALLMGMIQAGFVLPAYAGSDATLQAMEQLPAMSADHFDAAALPDLCRWVLLDSRVIPGAAADSRDVLATNMTEEQLSLALALGSPLIYTHFYRDVPLIDGTLCRLQYDFSMPYADPALRGKLPDFQGCMTLLLLLWLAAAVLWITRRTARQLREKTGQLTLACRILAEGDLSVPMPGPTHLRELDEALQTMDRLRKELAASLKAQWLLEEQRSQRLAALAHDLKTPLTVVRGNAELLAEDVLPDTQQQAVEAILRSSDRAVQYVAALRDVCAAQVSHAPAEVLPITGWLAELRTLGQELCTPHHVSFAAEFSTPNGATLQARRQELTRAVENLLANAVRFTPAEGQITLGCRCEAGFLILTVQDTGSGFPAEILQHGAQMFSTGDAARSDGHQGLGLYFARTVAEAHGGSLQLCNTPSGALATLQLPLHP